ncbi:carbamoyl phosphate synthase L chain, ATP binding domain protein [Hyaloraphidium curvatum]|nr:carbamoyl phosphate synthase L chain, ATP binding domain protein [Hyaloraphidium curvatum]
MAERRRLGVIAGHLAPALPGSGPASSPNLLASGTAGLRVLIANRGEIAIRVARAVRELGGESVAVFSEDDAAALHARRADHAVPLKGSGAAAYLDIQQIVGAAKEANATAVHPGYGFLSEVPDFARAVVDAGLKWIGPAPECLELFGDKLRARGWAASRDVPVVGGVGAGTGGASADEVVAFFEAAKKEHGGPSSPFTGVMIKALFGGGGRGMRALSFAISGPADVRQAYDRCRSEAEKAFGRGEVYAELLIGKARHVEVQVLGDGRGGLVHVWERECSIQRRNQKILEIAPAPGLAPATRAALLDASLRLLAPLNYAGLATVEYLVPFSASGTPAFFFMECNPRLQVEHTVTEEVTGMDLVAMQIRACVMGHSVSELLEEYGGKVPECRGFAVQLRVNMERIMPPQNPTDAPLWIPTATPPLVAFETPSAPHIRVDHCGYSGLPTNPSFDSLLAKLVVRGRTLQDALDRAFLAAAEFRIEGVDTTLAFLSGLVRHPLVRANGAWTGWLDAGGWKEVLDLAAAAGRPRYWTSAELAAQMGAVKLDGGKDGPNEAGIRSLGTQLGDLAAVLKGLEAQRPAGTEPVRVPMQSTVVSMDVAEGDRVLGGQQVAVVEAMKMEHVVSAPAPGIVRRVVGKKGMTVPDSAPLLFVEPRSAEEMGMADSQSGSVMDLERIRPDLQEMIDRQNLLLDAHRPEAVAKRRKTKQRTVRENIEELVDPGSFYEWGGLALANQKSRRTFDWLLKNSPGDGVVTGIASVNGNLGFPEEITRCLIFSYDYTVLAGTQGKMNHKKSDRVFDIAHKHRLPIVMFAEGGGGRPGDDSWSVAGLDNTTFLKFAQLSGLVPLVGIVSGRCFAGNAALLGCCDVIISTRNANIGMGGPAMIEGGGLGVFTPEDVGPVSVQEPNGVIDVLVENEQEAVQVAKKYLSYFQGPVKDWTCYDQRILRHLIPENRLRVYDIREVIKHLADTDSVLELRPKYGLGMITSLIRVEGRPMGLIANDSRHLGGAIDGDDADKAARFLQLCDAHDLPVLSLCDTPGFMVGPEAEKTSLVRRVCRMFVVGGNIDVPFFCVVVRKGYGLGAQAMAGGSFHMPTFTVSWPNGEFGGMGLEGSVRLAYRNELNAIADPDERQAKYESMVASAYARGKALNMATTLEIDNVIDPAETRAWIVRGLKAQPPRGRREGKKRAHIDTW